MPNDTNIITPIRPFSYQVPLTALSVCQKARDSQHQALNILWRTIEIAVGSESTEVSLAAAQIVGPLSNILPFLEELVLLAETERSRVEREGSE